MAFGQQPRRRNFWCALRDRALGLRPGRDAPVAKYRLELERYSESRRIALQLRAEQGRRAYERERARAIRMGKRALFRLEKRRDNFEALIEKKRQQFDREHALLTQAKLEFDRADQDFQEWRTAVGRPPFSTRQESLFDQLRFRFQPKEGGPNGVADITAALDWRTVLGSIPRRAGSMILGLLGLIVIPLDIAYAYPGFRAVLGEETYALIGATLLGLVLFTIGTVLATLYTRMRTRRCAEGDVKRGWNASAAVLFAVTALIGLMAVYAGATIRSVVPEAANLEARAADITGEIDFVLGTSARQMSAEDREREIADLEERELALQNDLAALRTTLIPRPTADAVLAFCFYGFAVLSLMISRITSIDPVFEYHLAAMHRRGAQRALLTLENAVENGMNEGAATISALDAEIVNARRDVEEADGSDDTQERMADAEREIEMLEIGAADQVRRDALAYAKWLRFLTRDPEAMREWERLFDDGVSDKADPPAEGGRVVELGAASS